MGISAHPYIVTPLQVRGGFLDNWGMAEPGDVAISWLRLPTPMDCIPHPYHIHTKCFNTLICCEWAWVHHYTVTPVQVRGGF
jgi:hypothetical protein